MAANAPLKALIAEDEPAMLGLLGRHVRGMGFNVVEASEGDSAWELAQKHHPDLVVLDVMMPGMSGWEVCKRIKGHGKDHVPFQATGVIMLTGIGENLNDMTSPLFAADTWLNKPFDFNELEARIHETLGKYGKSIAAGAPAPAPKRTAAKKAAAKKAPATKAPAKKAPAKRVAKKSAAKPAAKKSPAKKAAKKAPAKKAAAKKAVPKKAAKKTARAK